MDTMDEIIARLRREATAPAASLEERETCTVSRRDLQILLNSYQTVDLALRAALPIKL